MTRQDAYAIARKRVNDGYSFIDALEALGLIKFEEEKKTVCGIPIEVVIEALTKHGYSVVKIGVN